MKHSRLVASFPATLLALFTSPFAFILTQEDCSATVSLDVLHRDGDQYVLGWKVEPTGCDDCTGMFSYDATVVGGSERKSVTREVAWPRSHGETVEFNSYFNLASDEELEVGDPAVLDCTCYP